MSNSTTGGGMGMDMGMGSKPVRMRRIVACALRMVSAWLFINTTHSATRAMNG